MKSENEEMNKAICEEIAKRFPYPFDSVWETFNLLKSFDLTIRACEMSATTATPLSRSASLIITAKEDSANKYNNLLKLFYKETDFLGHSSAYEARTVQEFADWLDNQGRQWTTEPPK